MVSDFPSTLLYPVFFIKLFFPRASQVVLVVKKPPASAGDVRDMRSISNSIPELERSPAEGNGNSLQHSCMENSMDRGAWQTAVYGFTKSWTLLKHLAGIHALFANKHSIFYWLFPNTDLNHFRKDSSFVKFTLPHAYQNT